MARREIRSNALIPSMEITVARGLSCDSLQRMCDTLTSRCRFHHLLTLSLPPTFFLKVGALKCARLEFSGCRVKPLRFGQFRFRPAGRNRIGRSRTSSGFRLASWLKKALVSGHHPPPTSPANTTNLALPRGRPTPDRCVLFFLLLAAIDAAIRVGRPWSCCPSQCNVEIRVANDGHLRDWVPLLRDKSLLLRFPPRTQPLTTGIEWTATPAEARDNGKRRHKRRNSKTRNKTGSMRVRKHVGQVCNATPEPPWDLNSASLVMPSLGN